MSTDILQVLRDLYNEVTRKDDIKAVADAYKSLQAQIERMKVNEALEQLPEAPASATAKVVDQATKFEWLVTFRAHSIDTLIDDMPDISQRLAASGLIAFDAYVDQRRTERANSAPPAANGEPPGLPPQNGNGETLTFDAERLVANVNDGNTYWKVKGGPFSQWGVPIWPEALKESGFNLDALDPVQGHNLTGYAAHYITKDNGQPKKVTKLTKLT